MLSESDFVGLVLTQLVVTGLSKFVGKTFEVTSHLLARYTTTSVEIHNPYGTNLLVTSWLREFIDYKCGQKLSHFRITHDIESSRLRFYEELSGFSVQSTEHS